MSYVIKTAKTVEEAVSKALKELNISKDEAKIEIIDEGSKGFLGFGSKDATVKVSQIIETEDLIKEIFNEEPEESQKTVEIENKSFTKEENNKIEKKNYNTEKEVDIVDKAGKGANSNKNFDEIVKEFMDKVMTSLGIEYDLDISMNDNVLNVNILGDEQKLGIVIGKRGITLDSIQYILSLIVNRNSDEFIRVIVDSSGYREKRRETLRELSIKMAAKVLKQNRSIRLEPMSALDRKIIHESLQDYEGVITHSEGKEPYRKVVIQKERKY